MIPLLGPDHVGLLGELRLTKRDASNLLRPFYPALEHLLWNLDDLVLSRRPKHYSHLTIAEAIEDILRQWNTLASLDNRRACACIARYIVLDRALNRLVRIADRALRANHHETATLSLYHWSCQCIDMSTKYVAAALLGVCSCQNAPDLPVAPPISTHLASLPTRPVLEMDNLPLIFWRAMSSKILLHPRQVLISPLLGGGLVAPMLAALQAESLWSYVVASLYDVTGGQDVLVAPGSLSGGDIILVDDNLGTGATLGLVRATLQKRGLPVAGITAIEMHWEKFFNVHSGIVEGHTFHLADIDEASPFAYRHYATMSRLRQQYCMGVVNDRQTVADWVLWSHQWLSKIRNAPWLTEDEHSQIASLLPLLEDIRPIFAPSPLMSR